MMKNLIYLFFLLPLIFNCGGNSGPSELEASVVIQDFVKDKLKSPSTAEFDPGIVRSVKRLIKTLMKHPPMLTHKIHLVLL